MKKLKFIIGFDHPFNQSIGGSCALHQLCHELNLLGEESYTTSPTTHVSLNAPYVGTQKFKRDEVVVIYPEVIHGNPLQAQNVVRWLLNTPGACQDTGDSRQFYNYKKDTDLIFKYLDIFELDNGNECAGILTCTFSDKLECFRDHGQSRSGSCFLIKKGGMKEQKHPNDSINFKLYENDVVAAAQLLNQVEYFYCYDNLCYWSYLAALCGCTSVVIPDGTLTAEQWRAGSIDRQYGIAYGLDEIQRAKETLPQLYIQHKLIKEQEFDSVRNFIKICYEKFAY